MFRISHVAGAPYSYSVSAFRSGHCETAVDQDVNDTDGKSGTAAEDLTVYIVEDDEALRDSLVVLMESEGFDAAGFASGEAFLKGYHPDGAACLVLDFDLPGNNGSDLLRSESVV